MEVCCWRFITSSNNSATSGFVQFLVSFHSFFSWSGCSSFARRAPGKKATVPMYKVLVRPGGESNSRPTSTEADALTNRPRTGKLGNTTYKHGCNLLFQRSTTCGPTAACDLGQWNLRQSTWNLKYMIWRTCWRMLKQNKRKSKKSADTMRNNLDGDSTKSCRIDMQFMFKCVVCWLTLCSIS